jgi:hypothetical protein
VVRENERQFDGGSQVTWITETNEMEDPVNDGGLDNLELGLAE